MDSEASSETHQDDQEIAEIDYSNRLKYHLRIPFPSELYAESAMKSIGVDPPFLDTKTRKTTIRREMFLEVLEGGVSYLNLILSCDDQVEEGVEIKSLRTCAKSHLNNLKLICQTMQHFGPE